jgi:hypothetical protein
MPSFLPHRPIPSKNVVRWSACLLMLTAILPGSLHGSPDQEAAARKDDIDKQLAELRARSQRTIDDGTRLQLNGQLREIVPRKGQTDVFPGLFRVKDVQRVMNNAEVDEEGSSLEGLKLFNRQLAERGIDLIVVPVVSQVVLHAHKLVPGKIQPGDDIWPAYTQILIDLLEDGIEVIDLQGPFAEHLAKNPNDDPLNLFDHHWSSTGRSLGARLVADRLQRYAFIRDAAAGKRQFSSVEVDGLTVPDTYLSANSLGQDQVPSLNMPATLTETQILHNGAPLDTTGSLRDRIDPLLILGDSQALFRGATGQKKERVELVGSNFAEHLSREVGFPVPHRAENGGANFMPRRYAERWIHEPKQPRVIVMAMVMDQLLRDWAAIPLPDEKGEAVEASARLVGTDETTLGDWKGKYGADGHFIVGQQPQLPPSLLLNGSPQVIPTINVPSSQVFTDSESHLHIRETTFPRGVEGPHCLLLPEPKGKKQRSTTVWQHHFANDKNRAFAVDVNFQDDQEHQVALYIALLAEKSGNAWTNIEVQNTNAADRETLVPEERIEYGNKGVYVIYRVKGRVRFLIRDGLPALAGLFFDVPPGVARSTASSAPTPGPARPPGPASAPKPLTPATAAVPAKFTTVSTIEFVSVLPNPKTSPYADALTTVVVQAGQPFPGTDKTRAYVIGWAFKNRALLYASKIRQGQKWQLTLADWNQILQQHPGLESVMRIDDTEFDPGLPVLWMSEGRPLP